MRRCVEYFIPILFACVNAKMYEFHKWNIVPTKAKLKTVLLSAQYICKILMLCMIEMSTRSSKYLYTNYIIHLILIKWIYFNSPVNFVYFFCFSIFSAFPNHFKMCLRLRWQIYCWNHFCHEIRYNFNYIENNICWKQSLLLSICVYTLISENGLRRVSYAQLFKSIYMWREYYS